MIQTHRKKYASVTYRNPLTGVLTPEVITECVGALRRPSRHSNEHIRIKPPRSIHRKNYRSFTYPQYGNGVKLVRNELHCSKIGKLKLRTPRP